MNEQQYALAKSLKTFNWEGASCNLCIPTREISEGAPNRNNEEDNDNAHLQLRSDARRQFKDEYSKKLDLELDVSKGRLGMHGKGFYIVVNGDVD